VKWIEFVFIIQNYTGDSPRQYRNHDLIKSFLFVYSSAF